MKTYPRLFSAKTFTAMEVGADTVLVVIADKKDNGELRLLGGGEAKIQGIEKGEIKHVGDVVECIVSAAAKAEKSAGSQIKRLYYNFDDAQIKSVWPQGSKILDGEGEVQPKDVREAMSAAERLAGNFENKIVYSTEADYVIDDSDPVADPIGIFGHKLDVKAHLLLVRADRADVWSRLLRRSGFSNTIPVLSGFSSAHGVLSPAERQATSVVWDLGKDYLNGLVLSRGKIMEYRSILSTSAEWGHLLDVVVALSQEFKKKYPAIQEVVFTGELMKDRAVFSEAQKRLEVSSRVGVPSGMTRFGEVNYASIAGLLQVAGEIEKKTISVRPEKNTLSHARAKVRSFLSDYF